MECPTAISSSVYTPQLIRQLSDRIDALTTQLGTSQATVATLTGEVATLTANAVALQARVAALEATAGSTDTDIFGDPII